MSFWDLENDDEFPDFYKWETNKAEIVLDKPINQYKPIEKDSSFGKGKYIKVKTPIEVKFFKVDSKRLRKALILLKIDKYPVKLEIERKGSGFNTMYTINVFKK